MLHVTMFAIANNLRRYPDIISFSEAEDPTNWNINERLNRRTEMENLGKVAVAGCEATIKQAAIFKEMELLDHAVQVVEAGVQEMEVKLQPVLSTADPETDKPEEVNQEVCELSTAMSLLTKRLNRATYQLGMIKRRVEL